MKSHLDLHPCRYCTAYSTSTSPHDVPLLTITSVLPHRYRLLLSSTRCSATKELRCVVAQPKDAHPNRMLFNFVSLSQPCSRARFERSMDPRTQIGESAICARLNSSIQHPQIGSVTVSHGSSSHAGRRQGTLIRPPQRRPYHPRARVLRHNRLAFWLRRQPRPLQRRSRCQEEGLSAESHATHRMRGWRTQRTRSCHG